MLTRPNQSPQVRGLRQPEDFYWVHKEPTLLAGMRLPEPNWPWQSIYDCGFSKLISLHPCHQDPTPLIRIHDQPLEDLVSGDPPKNPELEISRIRSATGNILRSLSDGEGVVVHCWGGRGRTGTVLGCALRELGYEGQAVVKYLEEIHCSRGRQGWPESTWQAEIVRNWLVFNQMSD